MVGMWMLTHAPERIDKAVLANTAAYMGPVELWNGRIETARRGGMRALVEPTIEPTGCACHHGSYARYDPADGD